MLREYQVDAVLTYGDSRYYTKVGFEPILEHKITAPFALQVPHG